MGLAGGSSRWSKVSAGRKERPGQQEAGGSLVQQVCRGLGITFRFSFICSKKPLDVFEQRSDTSEFLFYKRSLW